MYEYRLDQKITFLAADILLSQNIDFKHPSFFSRFFDLEAEMNKLSEPEISRRFAMAQSQLECADIDRLLHNFATSLEHHQIAKRLSSLKAALAALQPPSPERTFLRRIFGF
ncbi:hypothetical protein QO002_006281 [Pararhizobium capsulatum DSM 1112]|uniref:Uncharacterized protein n=1 Tax=Pararhizobium capsulatum DSM 1112 TaxID=1121113 RepID=A0ABU0BZV1_9HYPH|nr:hypothetical protein [Pararhizobium capsulatum]MDQ0323477.1 hypothetical protein [Pararhizobium capsulatum DSM 1112]MDQ0324074.1 hypothetical protein [Pararhizobium capsulatum DSM 1112]